MRLLAALYERMGLNAYALGDYDKAERWMARLSRSEGESMRVLRNLGVVRMARGDFAGARRYLEREERLYGETPERHRVLGDLAYAAGVRDEAVKRYASARKTAGDEYLDELPHQLGAGIAEHLLRLRVSFRDSAIFIDDQNRIRRKLKDAIHDFRVFSCICSL